MKKYLLLTAALFIGFQVNSFAQRQDICQNLYVWPFTDAAGQKTLESKMLTDEVEEVLTQISGCLVLQRRNFASLTAQVENERAIQSLENLPVSIDEGLNTIRAETVLLGTVNKDFTGNISLQVSFQSLNSKRILLQNSIFLMGQEAQNVYNRREKIRQFILACINPDGIDEQRDWEETQQIDTPDAYKLFLQKYPNGKFRSLAETNIADEYAWNFILNEQNTKEKIELLEDYRNRLFTRHAGQANDMLERLLWENGKYKKYLSLFPEGEYADDAKRELERKRENREDLWETAGDLAGTIIENEIEPTSGSGGGPRQESNSGNGSLYEGSNTIPTGKAIKIRNAGNHAYNGYFLQLHKGGNIVKASNAYPGCYWELLPQGGNKYLIKNAGNHAYRGYYLQLHKGGNIVKASKAYSGCYWEIIPQGGNQYLIKNAGDHAYRGYYLQLHKEGNIVKASKVYTGCYWEIID